MWSLMRSKGKLSSEKAIHSSKNQKEDSLGGKKYIYIYNFIHILF